MRKPLALSALSGVFLFLSFPNFRLAFLAWLALVPLLAALARCPSRSEAAACGTVTGLIFFGVSIHWLTHVSSFGWVFAVVIESLFLTAFAVLAFEGLRYPGPPLFRVFWIPLAWTTAEFARGDIPVFGGGFNALAFSQADSLWVLQFASVAGACGLGFLIAMVNALLFEAVRPSAAARTPPGRRKIRLFWIVPAAAIFGALHMFGFFQMRNPVSDAGGLRVSLIQGNVPQSLKWEAEAKEKIIQLYLKMTELASFQRPHLIVWPEAAFPGYFNTDPASQMVLELVKKTGCPVLVGSPHLESPAVAYNSAYFVEPGSGVSGRYDKLRLVPFGEYVPMKPIFGWLAPLAYRMGVSDFSAGRDFTVFNFLNGDLPFSVLICFEDFFPGPARRFVERGARFLVVITNDAWFGASAAPYQHLQASVFRAVENGVPLVRAANTGVSAFISARGEILGKIQDADGRDTFVFGHRTMQIPVEFRATLYRRGGYLFPAAAAVLFGGLGIGVFGMGRMARKKGEGN